jgi:hypothetical protein
MTSRLKVAACALAASVTLSSAALAHDPDQLGEQLAPPFGERFTLLANFPTDQNPFNPANRNVTSSDIAFWGDLAYVGDYGGFRIFDISEPVPKLVSNMRCFGPQADPSVFDRNRDGRADTLVLSVDSVLTGPGCDAGPSPSTSTGWEGLRIFDVSDPADPKFVTGVYQDCGSHTNTLLPKPGKKPNGIYVLNSSYPLGAGPTCGPNGVPQGRQENHGVVQVVEVPFAAPSQAKEIAELPIVYPGDDDGVYRPVRDHGINAPLDNFLGCHDLSSFPALGIVGAACGEQAQVWEINKGTGLPDTLNPRWVHDQPNVDFWHSATFSWDGRVANFIDESFGDGCPTTTVKRDKSTPDPDDLAEFQTGNMFFFDTASGDLLSEYRIERGTNDDLGAGERLTYCSSHLGIPVPAKDRYLLVNAYYRGGSSVIDFSDPTAPKEIAYADLAGTNTWSAYTYPRKSGKATSIPVYSNDGLSRNYGTSAAPDYREASYGFMRFQAQVGRTNLVGFDRLNPQLQERVIPTNLKPSKGKKARTYAKGKPVKKSARRPGAREAAK